MEIDPKLREFATIRQLEYIDAVTKHGTLKGAARELGVTNSSIRESLDWLQKKVTKMGHSPQHDMTHTVPDGYVVKGVSTYYDKEGKPSAQWVKSSIDQQRMEEIMRASIEAMSQDIPRLAPLPGPVYTMSSLCNLYTLTDSHVGALCWGKEGGADWDLKIAESVLVGCFEHMVTNSPPAAIGFVNQLGDFLHYDNMVAVTPTNGHILDADGRFSKMVSVAIRILRRVIDLALSKHDKVVVLLAEGNHDIASSVWLRHMFKALYEKETRIQIIDSELPYYAYQHGKTMLSFHHGHLKKNDQLPILFAAQFPQMWGETSKRYAHTGHRHHVEEKEHSGMKVLQHTTLAARDAYAARGGWISEREVTAITYHDQFGLVARNTVTPEMLQVHV